jgi:hypothetical protein
VLDGSLITPHPHGPHPANMHNDAGNVSHDVYTVKLNAVSPGGLWEIEGYPYDLTACPFARQNCPEELKGHQGDCDLTCPYVVEVEYAIAMSPFYWKPGGEWLHTWWEGEWIWEWWWYKDDGDSCLPDFWWELGAWDGYDGPVAVANSLWWFDSKAETLVTGGWPTPPPAISDHYGLVTAYGAWDDHATSNTVPFIEDLAQNHLNTNASGTSRADMTAGISSYLQAQGVAGGFYTKTQVAPSFGWVADEVYMSEDVIVLLGFYEDLGGGSWERKGGHWVNLAGANWSSQLVGLSDPAIDNAITPSISGTLHLGRVFPPEHQGTDFTTEEKKAPQSISHDIYPVSTGGVPAGAQWELMGYPVTDVLTYFIGLNGGGTAVDNWGNSFATVAEWAIGVSPHSDLAITATVVPTETVPGGNVTIILQYGNHGLAAAHSVTITHLLAGNLTNINYVTFPPLTAIPGATYGWTLPKLSYGQGGTITLTAKVGGTGTVTHTARITGNNSIGGPTPDGNPANNVAGTIYRGLHLPVVMRN